MNLIMTMIFMKIPFEVSSVAATKLPSGWWPLGYSVPTSILYLCYK